MMCKLDDEQNIVYLQRRENQNRLKRHHKKKHIYIIIYIPNLQIQMQALPRE